MIIDAILGRKDSLHYDAKAFYNACMMYDDTGDAITRAMDGGIESEVKDALKQYIQDNEYNPLICDYIDRVNWLRGTEPTVEKAAAEEFDAACRLREANAKMMEAPEGKKSVFAFEVGVLLPREHMEFDFYACVNPDLPYGFYDENQGMSLYEDLASVLHYAREYVKKGVEKTYGIVSFQGFVDVDSDEHKALIDDDYDPGQISYSYFKNANEVVWSGCKIDGKLVECFLEKEIKALEDRKPTLDGQIKDAAGEKPGVSTQGARSDINLEI